MDFKKLLGSQWKDGMSNDDIVKALSEMDSVAGMISKDVFDKTAGELAEAKRKAKEKMTQEEQFEQTKAELEQLKKQLERPEHKQKNPIADQRQMKFGDK